MSVAKENEFAGLYCLFPFNLKDRTPFLGVLTAFASDLWEEIEGPENFSNNVFVVVVVVIMAA